jgi:hypothetical protein
LLQTSPLREAEQTAEIVPSQTAETEEQLPVC